MPPRKVGCCGWPAACGWPARCGSGLVRLRLLLAENRRACGGQHADEQRAKASSKSRHGSYLRRKSRPSGLQCGSCRPRRPPARRCTTLSDDERLFYDGDVRVRRSRSATAGPANGRAGEDPARADRPPVRARGDGDRDSRVARRRRRDVLPLRAGGRGVLARRPLDRRLRRRAEHAVHQRAAALRAATTSSSGIFRSWRRSALGAYALSEAGSGSDAFAMATPGRRSRRPLGDHRPQALDHQCRRGRPVHRLRQREPGRRLSRHHGVSGRARVPGLLRRQEGRQARHPRQQHVRAAARGVPRAARQRARRRRQGLQGRDRDAQRGPDRHRRADGRPRPGRASTTRSSTRRSGSSSASRSPNSRRSSTRSRGPRPTSTRRG